MNAITIRCPTCNAALHVPNEAATVTCSYCHTPCRIQHRSRIWQIPQPPPPPVRDGRPPMPVAKVPVKIGAMVIAGSLASMLVAGGGAAFMVMQGGAVSSSSSSESHALMQHAEVPTAEPAKRPETLRWDSSKPLLRDLDGDGDDDLIGMVNGYVDSKSLRYVAAYSGKDGRALWRSAAVPDALGTQAYVTIAGDRALLSGDDGKVYAYQLDDGAAAWTLEVGERVELYCRLDDAGKLRIITKDERARDVELASGAATPVTGKSRRQLWRGCDAIPTDNDNSYGQAVYNPFHRLPNVRGMYTRSLVKRGDTALISGGKSPGTGIPMVALRKGKEVVWRAELPSSDPLTSQMSEAILYVDSRVALATYSTNSGSAGQVRLVALATEDGRRLWEAPLSSGPGSMVLSSVLATQRRAIAVTWTYALAFDLETGKPVFAIGN